METQKIAEAQKQEPWDEESREFADQVVEWFEVAQTGGTSFEEFVGGLMSRPHTEGTIIWAAAAAMAKALAVVEAHPDVGRLHEFQRSRTMWAVMVNVFGLESEAGLRLQDFDWALSPQLETRFNAIPEPMFGTLQRLAKQRLARHESGDEILAASIREHLTKIAAGVPPFGLKIERVEVESGSP